jgi:PKD repeat protein
MKTKFYFQSIFVLLLLWSSISVFSQSVSPDKVINPVGFDKSEKLSTVKVIPPMSHDGLLKVGEIPNEVEFGEEMNTPPSQTGPDPVLRNGTMGSTTAATVHNNFDGIGIQCSGGGCRGVPNTNGDVGPDHFMQIVNATFQIFDKNGNTLFGPVNNSTLWDGFVGPWTGTNNGEPIVLYDEYADRWIASQRALPFQPDGPFYELVAVSQTGDPTGAWYRYAYEFDFSPYKPKLGVWPDGYYFTMGTSVCVVDRAAMIAGDTTAPMIMFTASNGLLLPSDADGATQPPAGSPSYIMCLDADSLRMWEVNVDWENPSNSSMTNTTTLCVDSYSNPWYNISQLESTKLLWSHYGRLMPRLQYRNFGTHEVLLTNHTVNVNGHTAIRWYEIRNTGGGWNIYQQGTFDPADGHSRFIGSMAMNGNGDIALGYCVSSSSMYPSIRVAGQTVANSGTGVMDVYETSILEGYASHTDWSDWGHISMMTVDPCDDETFWHTNEYSNGGFYWRTQIASFTIAPYCRSHGNSTALEWIQAIDMGTYTNNSGDNGGYLDNTTNPVSVESGQSYSFTGTPGYSDRSRREYWRVWIDLNADGDFEDAGEEVFTEAGKGAVSGSISIPAGLTGDTRMRVSMKYQAAADPCEQFTYGEVEDYKLTFATPEPQIPVADFEGTPTTLTVGNSVDFTDLSLNNPISWNWTFTGGTPGTSTEQNPTVTYNTEGTYAVSLTATNGEGSDTETKLDYITVEGACPDSDGDGVCDADDICPGYDDNIDTDGDGIPDGCDDCTSVSNDFPINPLTHSGPGSSSTSFDFGTPGHSDVSFVVSDLNAKTNGGPNRYIDFVTVSYTDADGTHTFGTFSGENISSANVDIGGPIYSVTVTLEDGFDGIPPGTLSVDLSSISSCPPSSGMVMETVEFGKGSLDRTISDLSLYPNPAHEVVTIRYQLIRNSEIRMRITDIKGVTVYDLRLLQKADMQENKIEISHIQTGVYFLHLRSGDQMISKKFVISR